MNIYIIRANLIQCAFVLREVSHSPISYHSNKWIEIDSLSEQDIHENLFVITFYRTAAEYGSVVCDGVPMADIPTELQDSRVFKLHLRGNGLHRFPDSKLEGTGMNIMYIFMNRKINTSLKDTIYDQCIYIYDLITHFNRRNALYFGIKTISYIWFFWHFHI